MTNIRKNASTNICTNRKWLNRFYDIYEIPKRELGNYRGCWFIGKLIYSKDKLLIYTDELWTIVRVDQKTANHLYNRIYNPICISITCPIGAKFLKNDKEELLYNMRATINSIDDSSYTIWFNNVPYLELQHIRIKIMKYIDSLRIINGEDFINHCETLGADPKTKDYD